MDDDWRQIRLDLARAQFCIANAQMSTISQDAEMVADHTDTAALNLAHALGLVRTTPTNAVCTCGHRQDWHSAGKWTCKVRDIESFTCGCLSFLPEPPALIEGSHESPDRWALDIANGTHPIEYKLTALVDAVTAARAECDQLKSELVELAHAPVLRESKG